MSIENHVHLGGECKKVRAMLRFDGGDEMKSLFDNVGVVVDGYTFEEALTMVVGEIQQLTTQATVQFSLFQPMP